MDVYRCKGVLNILDSDELHTLQVIITSHVSVFLETLTNHFWYNTNMHCHEPVIENFVLLNAVQAVREIYDIVPSRAWKKEENRMNRIVFIGNVVWKLVSHS